MADDALRAYRPYEVVNKLKFHDFDAMGSNCLIG
jgi:hypothetical protein